MTEFPPPYKLIEVIRPLITVRNDNVAPREKSLGTPGLGQ